MKAKNGEGIETGWVDLGSQKTQLCLLNAPILASPLDGIMGQPTSTSLQWVDTNNAPKEQGYRVRIKAEGGDYSYREMGQNVTSYLTTGLLPYTKYYWNVQAMGNGTTTLDSEWANSGGDWTFRTQAYSFPFFDDFSTDKGWIGYQLGGWERGAARAGGGAEYGYPDPAMDHSAMPDGYVLGFAIGADYPNNLIETSVISPPVDCSGQDQVFLKFWRYLNVGAGSYDRARVYASNDGLTWEEVWRNPDLYAVTDNRWVQAIYDISSVAADRETVYIMFTMGPTDEIGRFSGWNIDDFEVTSEIEGYAIWGFIRDKYGTPVSGTEVCFKDNVGNDVTACVQADDEGFYIQYGFETYDKHKKNVIQVIPYHPAFKFSPKKKSVKIKGMDVMINFKGTRLK